MDHLIENYIVYHVFYYDPIDNEINAVVHATSSPENKLSVSMWEYLLPDRQNGTTIRGILSLELVEGYEKKPEGSIMHIQESNHVQLEAVVEVVKILDAAHVLVKTDLSDQLMLVGFEKDVRPEIHDLIHVKGELHLQDADLIDDLLY